MKKHIIIFLLIFFITIGFASVSTVLDIKGNVNIAENLEDFKIEITNLKINNDAKVELISANKKAFTFTGTGNDTLEYTVTNYSYQYDTNINLVCTPNDNVTIEQINNLSAQNRITKTINTTNTSEITCTINVEKVSRTDYAEDMCKYVDGTVWTFNYTGAEQEFTVPCDGNYKIELWGAQGGTPNNLYPGGTGAYVSGSIDLKTDMVFYIQVGGAGEIKNAGYNGGGTGGDFVNRGQGSGGGGATDIRLESNLFNSFSGLKSRIIIAAGGGGGAYYGDSTGSWGHVAGINGVAGGISGTNGYYKFIEYNYHWGESPYTNRESIGGFGATQTSGGKAGTGYPGTGAPGSLGIGGSYNGQGAAAGGGGYYGGGSSARNGFSGGGGSSFISGHDGCNSIAENSTQTKIIHTGQPNHYSGLVFTDTVMVDGAGYKWTNVKGEYTGMPTHDGKSTMTGNSGNGYAKITYLR